MSDGRGLEQAILLARSGDKETARKILEDIVFAEPSNERAWIWLADTIADSEQRLVVLEQCLKANPESRVARTALERFKSSLKAGQEEKTDENPAAQTQKESDDREEGAATQTPTSTTLPEQAVWSWRMIVILLLTLLALMGTNLWLWLTQLP